MAIKKYDWIELKKDWLISDDKTVKAFCKRKGLPDPSENSFIAEKTKGWITLKDEVKQKALEEFGKQSAEKMLMDTKEVRMKQAQIARDVIEKATAYLLDTASKIKNVEEARKLLETGIKVQRDALGISDRIGQDQGLTQINIYASKFGDLVDGQDEQGLTRLIEAVRSARRTRTPISGEQVIRETGSGVEQEAQ
jgi:hypothetical protein